MMTEFLRIYCNVSSIRLPVASNVTFGLASNSSFEPDCVDMRVGGVILLSSM